MAWYAIASLTPAAILAVACLLGGGWAWGALATMTVAIAGLDRLTRVVLPARAGDGAAVAVLLGLVHFVLLFLGVRALSGAVPLTGAQMVALTAALGSFFGQVSNSDAHELIHARNRWRVRLGTAVYVSLLFGHHVSAHLRVHHPHVATPRDPNSARAGEGFYRFWARAWAGSFREGWRAETRLRQGRGLHPYAVYGGGALATLAAASLVGGWRGVAALGVLALWAQTQLLLADYVQHYGLCRETRADGSAEPVGAAHSWNAAPWFSGAMMLNAPRHSDHHLNPARPFPALRIDTPGLPMLPAGIPAMAMLATVPPLWRRVMARRLAALARVEVNQRLSEQVRNSADSGKVNT